MSIIRIQKRENPFVQIDKGAINNPNLTWKAKGLLTYLISKPDNWKTKIEDLVNKSTDGREACRSGLLELEQNGYILKRRMRDDNGQYSKILYDVFELPQLNKNFNKSPAKDNESKNRKPDSGFKRNESTNGKSESGPKVNQAINGKSDPGFKRDESTNGFSVNGLSVNGKTVNGKSHTTNNNRNNNNSNNNNNRNTTTTTTKQVLSNFKDSYNIITQLRTLCQLTEPQIDKIRNWLIENSSSEKAFSNWFHQTISLRLTKNNSASQDNKIFHPSAWSWSILEKVLRGEILIPKEDLKLTEFKANLDIDDNSVDPKAFNHLVKDLKFSSKSQSFDKL